ncbi:hypothetical protein [Schleiferilactobacillus shenzhenensis]|uniref:Uncharacterized protein n=1 Tax=Schleiferilactobacillus shenzhenensis LY-73 TaxID=1231336 RepID=U4TNM8_9LACO|nr:hypothetical protein [Schleiferilactobacillus shenzhenensis]ERL66491.1 hypothetical protein L248_0170 [Schleiferilactobacillus shenzhenensis LY-73]
MWGRKKKQPPQAAPGPRDAFKARDAKRIAVEKAYAKKQRQEARALTGELAEAHSQRLKRRLNWTIAVLVMALIGVFLVLWFVD